MSTAPLGMESISPNWNYEKMCWEYYAAWVILLCLYEYCM